MVLVSPLVMRVAIVVVMLDDGLWKEMREVVNLMKNLSLNLLRNTGANRGQKKPFN